MASATRGPFLGGVQELRFRLRPSNAGCQEVLLFCQLYSVSCVVCLRLNVSHYLRSESAGSRYFSSWFLWAFL